jgi:hypothetical protein
VTRLRILGIVWVIAGLIVGVFGLTMLGLAEDFVGAAAGAVVLVLAGLALPVGPCALRGVDPTRHIRRGVLGGQCSLARRLDLHDVGHGFSCGPLVGRWSSRRDRRADCGTGVAGVASRIARAPRHAGRRGDRGTPTVTYGGLVWRRCERPGHQGRARVSPTHEVDPDRTRSTKPPAQRVPRMRSPGRRGGYALGAPGAARGAVRPVHGRQHRRRVPGPCLARRTIAGLVLDTPMLHFQRTVDYGASLRRLPVLGRPNPRATDLGRPRPSPAGGTALGRHQLPRSGVVARARAGFHGPADPRARVATSDAFAATHPELVQEVRVDGPHTWSPERRARPIRGTLIGLSHPRRRLIRPGTGRSPLRPLLENPEQGYEVTGMISPQKDAVHTASPQADRPSVGATRSQLGNYLNADTQAPGFPCGHKRR